MSSNSLFNDDLRVAVPNKPVAAAAGTSSDDGVAAFNRLRPFMPVRQGKAVAELMRGEEGQFFIDKMVELARLVDSMPVTYQQQDEEDPMAYLHYFYGGSDWYITEKDVDGEVDQAFGFACLNGDMLNAEYGYISITELAFVVTPFGQGVDLDFHFKPARMSLVRKMLKVKNGGQA